jgi:hypothetical protein
VTEKDMAQSQKSTTENQIKLETKGRILFKDV